MRDSYPQLVMTSRMDISSALGLIGGILFTMAVRVRGGHAGAGGDLTTSTRRWQHEKQLRMSKEEIKQENKQTEGDPQWKSRIRARQRQIARKRMMADVPKADVIITTRPTLRVALRYDGEKMGAPIVVAKGQDLIAKRIREIAQGERHSDRWRTRPWPAPSTNTPTSAARSPSTSTRPSRKFAFRLSNKSAENSGTENVGAYTLLTPTRT